MRNHLLPIMMLSALGAMLAASEPSPFAGYSFPIFHPTSTGEHRCTLRFDRDGNAFSDLFPVNSIPATGTLKTKVSRSRRGRGTPTISEFSAKGESPCGKGSVSFTATKDGNGAKGSVTLAQPGKDPVMVAFIGSEPQKK